MVEGHGLCELAKWTCLALELKLHILFPMSHGIHAFLNWIDVDY
jgi:hypothetical protein